MAGGSPNLNFGLTSNDAPEKSICIFFFFSSLEWGFSLFSPIKYFGIEGAVMYMIIHIRGY